LYTRDTTCWIYGGLTLNPVYLPAPHGEALLMKKIYKFPPDHSGLVLLWGDPGTDWAPATLEGGAAVGPGNGVGVPGMCQRPPRQGITQAAAALFAAEAAEQVIVAGMPKLRSAMHLDTVFTFADRDVATAYPGIVDGIHPFTLRPGKSGGVEVTEESRPFVD